MARLVIRGEALIVKLAWWEKIAARRGDVQVPLAAVKEATVQRSWRSVLRGTPGRGVWIDGSLALGVRQHAGAQDFVAIRTRQLPVTCIDLRPALSPFTRIVITDRVPEPTAATLRTALSRLPATPTPPNAPAFPVHKPGWLPAPSPTPCPPATQSRLEA
ncbi:hypothetical protein WDA79_10770 [Streptomyces sp. A475]|uniref:hypothetical protein n=1 Tax=Streptomyces sp. A475 TaxID=3131976 RepID=UPI0030C9C311